MDLSVIIVNWNTKDLLAQCLQSVYETAASHSDCNLSFETVVVDNASTDGSPEMVRAHFPQVRLIENQQNEGFARANNRAIRATHGRYFLLLNSDTVVLPGSLGAMVHFADQHPEAGIVGCKLLNADGSLQPSWAQFPTFWSELMGRNFRRRRPLVDGRGYEVDWVGGACLLVRQKAVQTVGLLDEDYFMYSEETDWCYRFSRAGWAVLFNPTAQIVHLGGASSRKMAGAMCLQLRASILLFIRKNRSIISYVLSCGCVSLFFLLRLPVWLARAVLPGGWNRENWERVRVYAAGAWRGLLGWRSLCVKK